MSVLDTPAPPDVETAAGAERREDPPIGTGRAIAAVLLLVATLGLGFVAVTMHDAQRTQAALDADRADVVAVASEQAVTLLTIDADNVKASTDSLLEHSTGAFKRQLEGIVQTFSAVVTKGNVRSRGDVVSAAVSQLEGSQAQVLLALSAKVTNSETRKPESRDYRVQVDLTREGEQWLVSNMQFVP